MATNAKNRKQFFHLLPLTQQKPNATRTSVRHDAQFLLGSHVSYNSKMCGGIEYQDHKIYFPQPDARLPVRLRQGGVTWITWGRRKNEDSGKFPNGGWARLNSIKNGKWKPWHPRPILIPADNFMEKDHEDQSHWIPLDNSMAIQGLLAERKGEQRIYVVTVNSPPEHDWIHDRWPRLVKLSS